MNTKLENSVAVIVFFYLIRLCAETKVGVVDIKTASVQFHVQNKGNRGTAGQKFTFPSIDNFFNFGNGFDWSNHNGFLPHTPRYLFLFPFGHKTLCAFFLFLAIAILNEEQVFLLPSMETILVKLSAHKKKNEYGAFSFRFSRKLEKGDKIELVMYGQSAEVYLFYFTGWMLEQDLLI